MMQRILKGDTSGTIALALADGYNYAGCVVEFRYQGAVRTFRNCEAGQTVQFNFTAQETAPMALGAFPVEVRLHTPDGRFFTVNNADVKIEVTDCVEDVREGGVIVVEATSGLYGVDDLPARYTMADIWAKTNEIIQRLGGGVTALCLAACVACGSLYGAGVVVQKSNLEDIHNDDKVVTGVMFDASGLATDADVQQAEDRAKAHADDAAADKITAGTATNVAGSVVSNLVTKAFVEGIGVQSGVTTVNGQTGAVVIAASDVGALAMTNAEGTASVAWNGDLLYFSYGFVVGSSPVIFPERLDGFYFGGRTMQNIVDDLAVGATNAAEAVVARDALATSWATNNPSVCRTLTVERVKYINEQEGYDDGSDGGELKIEGGNSSGSHGAFRGGKLTVEGGLTSGGSIVLTEDITWPPESGGVPAEVTIGPMKVRETLTAATNNIAKAMNFLHGQTFDFSDNKVLYTALSNIIQRLGGSVQNFPTFQ